MFEGTQSVDSFVRHMEYLYVCSLWDKCKTADA